MYKINIIEIQKMRARLEKSHKWDAKGQRYKNDYREGLWKLEKWRADISKIQDPKKKNRTRVKFKEKRSKT